MINYHKHIKSGILCNWYSLLFNYQVYHLSFFDIIFTCYHFDTAINILTLTKKKEKRKKKNDWFNDPLHWKSASNLHCWRRIVPQCRHCTRFPVYVLDTMLQKFKWYIQLFLNVLKLFLLLLLKIRKLWKFFTTIPMMPELVTVTLQFWQATAILHPVICFF